MEPLSPTREPPATAAAPDPGGSRGSIRLGLISTPVQPADAGERLAADLAALLAERYPEVRWDVEPVTTELVTPPAHLSELVDAARARLLDEDWDLVVGVTELPLALDRRPLLTHASPTHGVALVSLPAFGVRQAGRRLRDAAAEAVGVLIGDRPDERRGALRRRLVELAGDVDAPTGSVAFLARVVEGNLRLLLGMIRANRPWRLAARLTDALVAALAAASFALVAGDVWRLAARLDVSRLTALTALAIVLATAALIAGHDLWERSEDPRTREQVALFNITTAATLGIGIASLCAAVFCICLVAALLLIDRSVLADATGQPAGLSEHLRVAWLASTLATVGGALGGALESDDAVREAAYAHHPVTGGAG